MDKEELKNLTKSEIERELLFESFTIPEGFKEFVYVEDGKMSFSDLVSMNTFDQEPDSKTAIGEISSLDIYDYLRCLDVKEEEYYNMSEEEIIKVIQSEDWNTDFDVGSDEWELSEKIIEEMQKQSEMENTEMYDVQRSE